MWNKKETPVSEITKSKRTGRFLVRMSVLFVLYIFLTILIVRTPWDPDTWFLAATGRWIVENRTIPQVNPFTIHENLYMIVQQWGMCVLEYFLVTHGATAKSVYLVVVYTAALLLTYCYLDCFFKGSKISKEEKIYRTALVTIVAGIHLTVIANTRPSILSYCNILFLLIAVRAYNASGKKCYLLAGLLSSILEINVHASFWPVLFIMILPYVFFDFLPKKGQMKTDFTDWFMRKRWLLLMAMGMLILGFANPVGTDSMKYMFVSYRHTENIAETAAPTTTKIQGVFFIFAVVWASIWSYLQFTRNRVGTFWEKVDAILRERGAETYMMAGTLLLAFLHNRNTWFLIIGVYPLALELIMEIKEKEWDSQKNATTYLVRAGWITFIGLFLFWQQVSIPMESEKDAFYCPMLAAEWLDEHADKNEITLYTGFNNGAYMEWRGYKPYIDARPEIYQKDINGVFDYYDEYMQTMKPDADMGGFLAKYGFTHLIVEKKMSFWTYLNSNEGYEIVVDTEGYSLFLRKE